MKTLSLNEIKINSSTIDLFRSCCEVLFGGIFLALLSQVSIPLPFTPVPITLQTLGVALLALTLGRVKAPLAVVCYLVQGSLGLPIFAGGVVRTAWMFGPTAGYLIGFVVAAYLLPRLLPKPFEATRKRQLISLIIASWTILTLGYLNLTFYVGWRDAFLFGILPFIIGDAIKTCFALTLLNSKKVFNFFW